MTSIIIGKMQTEYHILRCKKWLAARLCDKEKQMQTIVTVA